MFESVVLRRKENGRTVSAGQIAEALLFYRKVHLVLDRGTVISLVSSHGPDLFFRLLSHADLSSVYCENNLGTQTQHGTIDEHKFVTFRLAANKSGKVLSRKERIADVFSKAGLSQRSALRAAERFSKLVRFKNIDSDFLPEGLTKAATADLNDPHFVNESAAIYLETQCEMPRAPGFTFQVFVYGDKIHVDTNVNFMDLSQRMTQRSGKEQTVSHATVLSAIFSARADLAMASFYGGDFYTSDTSSKIIMLRHASLMRHATISSEEISQFQRIVLGEIPTIREAVDSTDLSLDEYLTFLGKRDSRRFSRWLLELNPDETLTEKYLQEISKQDLVNTLPAKLVRYALTSVSDLIVPGAGLMASAADSFLLERLAKGWRPSHFVEKSLKPLLAVNL